MPALTARPGAGSETRLRDVPAGTVDAFRVHCTYNDDLDELYWHSPDVQPLVKTRFVRGPRSAFGAGTQETEVVSRPS